MRAQQTLVCTKTQTKGAETPQETEPKPPASTGGSPMEAWISRGSPQGQGTGGSPWRPGSAVAPHRTRALEGLPWRSGSAGAPHRARRWWVYRGDLDPQGIPIGPEHWRVFHGGLAWQWLPQPPPQTGFSRYPLMIVASGVSKGVTHFMKSLTGISGLDLNQTQ